jgi:hypothetical protein
MEQQHGVAVRAPLTWRPLYYPSVGAPYALSFPPKAGWPGGFITR